MKCVFPFRYQNRVFRECIIEDHHVPWCPTLVDYNRGYVNGKWGNCGPECPGASEGITKDIKCRNEYIYAAFRSQ